METLTKLAFVVLSLVGLAACNTTAGFGQDVEAAGDQIEETANETKDKMTNDDD